MKNGRPIYRLTVCLLVTWSALLFAQGETNNAVFYSKILSREQPLQVYLPAGYATGDSNYPVLYILDGQFFFFHGVAFQQTSDWRSLSPQYLVVGISSVDAQQRGRDFGSEARLPVYGRFLEEELFPFVEKEYRASGERIIFGWESAGYLVTQILLRQPDLFDAYLVASGAAADSGAFEAFASGNPGREKFFYFAFSPAETWNAKLFGDFSAMLQNRAPAFLRWQIESLPEEDHHSTPYRTIFRGLSEYYRSYQPLWIKDAEALAEAGGLEGVERYYRERGQKYGVSPEIHGATLLSILSLAMRGDDFTLFEECMTRFTGEVHGLNPIGWYQRYGQFYLKHHQPQKTLALYEMGLKRYPEASALIAGMGEVYLQTGDAERARAQFRKALAIAEKFDEDARSEYREKLENLTTR
ncbi:MAG: hypothetical protein KDI06_07525 [Calditrichaeota bacterium]|nr:hypothetical protein [Calditrichota bacterium]HQU73813.1 alpha/beta hydrolase-fold protein [Calditrichia bacterium]